MTFFYFSRLALTVVHLGRLALTVVLLGRIENSFTRLTLVLPG